MLLCFQTKAPQRRLGSKINGKFRSSLPVYGRDGRNFRVLKRHPVVCCRECSQLAGASSQLKALCCASYQTSLLAQINNSDVTATARSDFVDHDILRVRLERSIGLGGMVLNWLRSFLTERIATCRTDRRTVPSRRCAVSCVAGICTWPLALSAVHGLSFRRHCWAWSTSTLLYTDDGQISPAALANDTVRRFVQYL